MVAAISPWLLSVIEVLLDAVTDGTPPATVALKATTSQRSDETAGWRRNRLVGRGSRLLCRLIGELHPASKRVVAVLATRTCR